MNNPDRAWPARYHDFLVLADHETIRGGSPRVDRVLNPVIGKSLVIYAQKVGRPVTA